MKSVITLIGILTSLLPPLAFGAELAVVSDRYFTVEGRENGHVVDSWRLEDDAITPGLLTPQRFDERMISMAVAPDHALYFVVCEDFVPLTDPVASVCLPQIRRTRLSLDTDGNVTHGPVEQVYRSAEPVSHDDYYHNLVIGDIAVRRTDDEGGYRVYFSTGGCGACEAQPRIFYLDDEGTPQLYYSVPRDGIGVSSCEGLSGHWSGNFDFDDDGVLYLSSGNHCPAGLFRVSGAGPDAVSGEPTQIYALPLPMLDFVVDAEGEIYFETSEWDALIGRVNIDTDELGEAMDLTTDLLGPPDDPSASIYVNDFDKMPTFPYRTSGRIPMARGPSAIDRARSLPGSDTASRTLPSTTVVAGALAERLTAPPTPDTAARQPDLELVALEAGRPSIAGDLLRLPLRVFVRNTGRGLDTPIRFSVGILFPEHKEAVPAAFKVHRQPDPRLPELPRLASNEVVALGGTLTVQLPADRRLKGRSIMLTAEVTGCLEPPAGTVKDKACVFPDGNEKNNRRTMKIQL